MGSLAGVWALLFSLRELSERFTSHFRGPLSYQIIRYTLESVISMIEIDLRKPVSVLMWFIFQRYFFAADKSRVLSLRSYESEYALTILPIEWTERILFSRSGCWFVYTLIIESLNDERTCVYAKMEHTYRFFLLHDKNNLLRMITKSFSNSASLYEVPFVREGSSKILWGRPFRTTS